jgi:hypothetical protein
MKRPVPIAAVTAAWVVFSPLASAAESAADRGRDATETQKPADVSAPAAETRVTTDNIQAARKPDEIPFNDIKILPSF